MPTGTSQMARNTLVRGRAYGLIGRNGEGKSTLLRAIASRTVGDIPPELTVHYVSQEVQLDDEKLEWTPAQYVVHADVERRLLLQELDALNGLESLDTAQAQRQQEVQSALEAIEADTAEERATALQLEVETLGEIHIEALGEFAFEKSHCFDPNEEKRLRSVIEAVGEDEFIDRIRNLGTQIAQHRRARVKPQAPDQVPLHANSLLVQPAEAAKRHRVVRSTGLRIVRDGGAEVALHADAVLQHHAQVTRGGAVAEVLHGTALVCCGAEGSLEDFLGAQDLPAPPHIEGAGVVRAAPPFYYRGPSGWRAQPRRPAM